MTAEPVQLADRFEGFLLGMAVGDALGLPREGIRPGRARRMYGSAPLRHRLVFGRGMVSDDTEHLRMAACALLQQPTDVGQFAKSLEWQLKWWLAALPAGTGMATARSILKLWAGWPADLSGVYSAGNGPAMRAGVIGLCMSRDEDRWRDYVRTSTRITHTDPCAEIGAVLIALAARETIRRNGLVDPIEFLTLCRQEPLTDEWQNALSLVEQSVIVQESADEFAARIQCERGISGYIIHTVAAVLFCWLRWPGEFRRPLEEVIMLGGDADTTGALLGGLAGASCGAAAIPTEWISRLIEWPYSVSWMRTVLSPQLQQRFGPEIPRPVPPSRVALPYPQPFNALFVLTRNLGFLGIVLTHGIRRLLPPY